MKNYEKFAESLKELTNEIVSYVKEHQGEKGYIDTQSYDGDTIRTFIYNEDDYIAEEQKVYGVRVKDGDLQICADYEPTIASSTQVEYGEDDFKDESNWLSVDSELVYKAHTIDQIAMYIEEYA